MEKPGKATSVYCTDREATPFSTGLPAGQSRALKPSFPLKGPAPSAATAPPVNHHLQRPPPWSRPRGLPHRHHSAHPHHSCRNHGHPDPRRLGSRKKAAARARDPLRSGPGQSWARRRRLIFAFGRYGTRLDAYRDHALCQEGRALQTCLHGSRLFIASCEKVSLASSCGEVHL